MELTNMEDDRIEHIGSTTINGMSAKVISNILVGMDDLKEEFVKESYQKQND